MVIDFSRIKKAVSDKLDHKTINDVGIGGLPTAENMAFYILHLVGSDVCYRVDVEETDGSIATYEEENTRMGISKQKHVYSGVRYSPGIRPDYNVLANKNAKRLGARKVR
jgi:6-pyruvoyl-tetrahydropterin synthase